jgi:hypothetical protein
VRSKSAVLLILPFLICLGSKVQAEVVQSSTGNGAYWLVRDGSEMRIGGPQGPEVAVDLPPGAVIRSLEPSADGWLAAGRMPSGDGTELLLIESRNGVAEVVEAPLRGPARYRGQPVLLMERGQLVGLVWAEGNGHRELEIWAAPRQGDGWGASELIAARGPGSQVAPAAVVLDDGSWLAVWAAYDGRDDEILCSHRRDGEWSVPARVHPDNDVPDLVPTLVPIDDGAMVAWSWFDGNDYRLRLSRWRDQAWSTPQTMGERGSTEPEFIESEGAVRLLYQTVSPWTWTVLELDRTGEARRAAVLGVRTYDRPLLLDDRDAGPRLLWPQLRTKSPAQAARPLEWQDLP